MTPGLELQHAQNIISAALASGTVTHLIYSSVQLAGQLEALPHIDATGFMATYWAAKNGIEEMLRKAGL